MEIRSSERHHLALIGQVPDACSLTWGWRRRGLAGFYCIGRISRYCARMRADGVLDENRYVTSVDAWDLGRASKMARWGLGARFGTLQEAEAAVVQAGRAAALAYRSWQDFSAGYILGRCLHFDEEDFGSWYTDMVDAHRILMTDPGSPWLNIPFR
ncbi:DUF1266 domain-containing protein [Streptomyces sp. NPDC032940]|uniref:DUF1266 domain-containing protein n=1 Tax=Streptomyces sp. NPDC032940 TaxID=3155366 RepID=UPI00340898F0